MCWELLEGKHVNLRLMEKEDLALYAEWVNDPEFYGQFIRIRQRSRVELEKQYDTLPPDAKWFLVEKRDGNKIGYMMHCYFNECWEIGYALVSSERGKGYGTEAFKIMVDYLFLSRDIVRVQAHTDVRNTPSQKALEKAGFKKEGVARKSTFVRGEWRDNILYSILREEWEEPKILTRTKS